MVLSGKRTRRDREEDEGRCVRRYQIEVLSPAREKMMDEDNSPTKPEMEEIQEDVQKHAPEIIAPKVQPDASVKPDVQNNEMAVALPVLTN